MTGIYHSWQDMIFRCTNSKYKSYKNYGGRGIIVCRQWLKFENFNKVMGKNWEPGITIERKDNDKGYFPKNCYWATRKEQARNRRNNRLILYCGKLQCLAVWSEETGILSETLSARIYRYGWSIRKAFTTPVRKRKKMKGMV